MAKLASEPITKDDLDAYLASVSDFQFEMVVHGELARLGFDCRHGGTYSDPITSKHREFDIRAIGRIGAHRLYLAAECKNLRANFPLLVSRLPRTKHEAYLDVVCPHDQSTAPPPTLVTYTTTPPAGSRRVVGADSLYRVGDPTGKSLTQVGREIKKEGDLVAGDSEIYDRWSQALGSSRDLFVEASEWASDQRDGIALVLPLVVVPDGRLWAADYNALGELISSPTQAESISHFVGAPIKLDFFHGRRPEISHLEFITLSGLEPWIKRIAGLLA